MCSSRCREVGCHSRPRDLAEKLRSAAHGKEAAADQGATATPTASPATLTARLAQAEVRYACSPQYDGGEAVGERSEMQASPATVDAFATMRASPGVSAYRTSSFNTEAVSAVVAATAAAAALLAVPRTAESRTLPAPAAARRAARLTPRPSAATPAPTPAPIRAAAARARPPRRRLRTRHLLLQ